MLFSLSTFTWVLETKFSLSDLAAVPVPAETGSTKVAPHSLRKVCDSVVDGCQTQIWEGKRDSCIDSERAARDQTTLQQSSVSWDPAYNLLLSISYFPAVVPRASAILSEIKQ